MNSNTTEKNKTCHNPQYEEDDMANELNYLREAQFNNNGKHFISNKKLSDDELLMINIIEE